MASDPVPKLLALASAGAAVYLGYRHVYLPWKARQDGLAAARRHQARTGASWQQSLHAVAVPACMAAALANGIPPQVSGAFCPLVASVGVEAVKQAPKILLGAGQGALKIAVSPVHSVKRQVSGAAKDVKKFFDDLF